MRYYLLLALILCGCQSPSVPPSAAEATPAPIISETPSVPTFTIKVGLEERSWTLQELLKHEAAFPLTITDHSAYEDQERTYLAIPLATLFDGLEIPEEKILEYQTTDGFSSSLEPSRLLNTKPEGAVAYLAVENPDEPWPLFESRTYGPGPFYVVWKNPEASHIGREEWPFKLTGFKARRSLEKRYPKLPPAAEVAKDSDIYRGYHLFIKNCFPCHKINQQGLATFGPDLNYPMSPTEYMKEGMIERYVRDPQSVRKWKNGKMPAFPPKELPDEELSHIMSYLKHKAATRDDL